MTNKQRMTRERFQTEILAVQKSSKGANFVAWWCKHIAVLENATVLGLLCTQSREALSFWLATVRTSPDCFPFERLLKPSPCLFAGFNRTVGANYERRAYWVAE